MALLDPLFGKSDSRKSRADTDVSRCDTRAASVSGVTTKRRASIKLRDLTVAMLASLLAPCLSPAQCPAPDNPQFKPFRGGENKAAGHFEWYSAAAANPQQGGGHPSHVFERTVTNLGKTTLKYSWPVGRMNNDALAVGKEPDHFCHEYGWPNQADGPLNYGRGNDQTKTTVWEGKDEPKANAILAEFAFNIESAGSTQAVSVRVLTSFQRTTTGAFSYDYLFENLHGKAVKLQWGVENDATLIKSLKSKGMTTEFVVEGKQKILVESKEGPTIAFRALNVIIGGKATAGVDVPMLIPGKVRVSNTGK